MTAKKAFLAALLVAITIVLYLIGRPKPPPSLDPSPPSGTVPVRPDGAARPISRPGEIPAVNEPSTVPTPASPDPTATAVPPIRPPAGVTMLPVAQTAEQLHSDEIDPQEDLHIIEGLLENYRRVYKENPVAGVNEDVVQALIGHNEKKVGLIRADHPAIDAQGQLVDRWGTPYVFHAISGKHMQLLSAGPDRKRGTEDDLYIE